ncbi:unnamed protein product [Kuraishia capsulata CBS 1993]|uniref:arginyltransferase n=1 Tax=Kuraishia capsulata CBS 1993 TaxID=1382522 RepID=W6MRT1_9ASCO|nr:uncharacterized protein KUCA_T00003932001 [Kuraishia capsulata CBS 1993]CDK27952.1 unnamed protein product [Kuraishia capsulata CBS 1993]
MSLHFASREDLFIFQNPVVYAHTDCGYCHGSKPDKKYGFSLESFRSHRSRLISVDYPRSVTIGVPISVISCERYERFLNLGYRRSGTFLYKMDALRGCCRMYPIRTNLDRIKLNKDHRHTVNRFTKRVLGTEIATKHNRPFSLDGLIEAESECSASRFHTIIEPADFSEEKFKLYCKYQIQVHKDKESDLSTKSFTRFLCKAPFRTENIDYVALNNWRKGGNIDQLRKMKGAIHECYYIDDQLVAVAVLDLLPNSVSSVYFIWDPAYASLGLGTLSALREALFTQRCGKQWYMMGYYIADCVKMKYKGKFGGEIWDQCSSQWVELAKVNHLIDDGRLCVFFSPEKEIPSRELPMKPSTASHEAKYYDIAETIYSTNGVAYKDALRVLETLGEINGLEDYFEENEFNLFDQKVVSEVYSSDVLPRVCPGLTPLWQIKELIDSKALENIEDCQRNPFVQPGLSLSKCNPDETKQVVDFVRLFGIDELKDILFV